MKCNRSFLDLRPSYLNITFKVVNSDGSNLAADAKAGLVNYLTAFLFQQVDVLLTGNLISCSTYTYACKAMFEVFLEYDQGTKNSYLTMRLYHKNEFGSSG